jgi:hypothetical protein
VADEAGFVFTGGANVVTSSLTESFYLLVTGAAPSTFVGNLIITYCVDTSPSSASLPMCVIDFP